MACHCKNTKPFENLTCSGVNCGEKLCNTCDFVACEHCEKVFCGTPDRGCAKRNYDNNSFDGLTYTEVWPAGGEITANCFDCFINNYRDCLYCSTTANRRAIRMCSMCYVDICMINCEENAIYCDVCNTIHCENCSSSDEIISECAGCSKWICSKPLEMICEHEHRYSKCSYGIMLGGDDLDYCIDCYNDIIKSTIIIQRNWKKARYNPKYKLCEITLINNLRAVGIEVD